MEFSNKLYYTNETGSFSLINGDTFKELEEFTADGRRKLG